MGISMHQEGRHRQGMVGGGGGIVTAPMQTGRKEEAVRQAA